MPVRTFFQTVPSSDLGAATTAPTPSTGGSNSAATQLSDAIDEFLADVEKKFKVMNDEILTKRSYLSLLVVPSPGVLTQLVDDMGDRCDRLEAELLLKEAEGSKITSGSADNSS